MNDIESFLTIKFDGRIQPGEHFRFIYENKDSSVYENPKVFEVIASNDHNLLRYAIPISQYVLTNSVNHTDYYRLNFYTQDTGNPADIAELDIQLQRLAACINKFRTFISAQYTDNGIISICSMKE